MGTVLSHEVELFLSFIGPVYALGFGLANLRGSRKRAENYKDLSKDVKIAPQSWLFGVVWFLLYTLMSVAGYLVRLEGGMYVSGVNLASLIYFWVLQVLLAIWSVIFFGLEQRVLGAIVVFVDLVLSAIVGVLFLKVSVWAAVIMFVVSAWLLFAFFLSLSIIFKRMDPNAARKIVRQVVVNEVDASLEAGTKSSRRSTSNKPGK